MNLYNKNEKKKRTITTKKNYLLGEKCFWEIFSGNDQQNKRKTW